MPARQLDTNNSLPPAGADTHLLPAPPSRVDGGLASSLRLTAPNLASLPLPLAAACTHSLSPQVWEGALTPQQRESVCAFLTRLKYDPCVHEDEWQAYLVTEKSNFFGMDLAEAQQQLAAAFPPGSWR